MWIPRVSPKGHRVLRLGGTAFTCWAITLPFFITEVQGTGGSLRPLETHRDLLVLCDVTQLPPCGHGDFGQCLPIPGCWLHLSEKMVPGCLPCLVLCGVNVLYAGAQSAPSGVVHSAAYFTLPKMLGALKDGVGGYSALEAESKTFPHSDTVSILTPSLLTDS